MMNDEHLRYPIGKFEPPTEYSTEVLFSWIQELKSLPGQIRAAVNGLSDEQLERPYRDGGWTIRQVVHHLPDSHMNALLRFKWAMTEDNPIIKPYDEAGFARLPDYQLPIDSSLMMLEGIHVRLAALFESFTDADWERTFTHPATGMINPLKKILGMYVWHGKHHLAHIEQAKGNTA